MPANPRGASNHCLHSPDIMCWELEKLPNLVVTPQPLSQIIKNMCKEELWWTLVLILKQLSLITDYWPARNQNGTSSYIIETWTEAWTVRGKMLLSNEGKRLWCDNRKHNLSRTLPISTAVRLPSQGLGRMMAIRAGRQSLCRIWRGGKEL